MPNPQSLQWYVVHTRPHQERKVRDLLVEERARRKNIIDIYAPSNTVVSAQRGNRVEQLPLFAGKVFVLSTRDDLTALLADRYPEGWLEYDKTRQQVMTIPANEMLFFMDFNERYPEKVIVLERPYSDYAFNAKNDMPNEAVMVADGPFQGKTGYLVKFRGQRRMVFQMENMAVSIPDIWDYRLVRLHNSGGDRQSLSTLKSRIADMIVGKLQACGFADNTHYILYRMLTALADHPRLADLKEKMPEDVTPDAANKLAETVKTLTADEASDILSLAHFVKTEPCFLEECRRAAFLRPFLTPTAGSGVVCHEGFVEVMRKLSFKEPTYYPQEDTALDTAVSYYAHTGIVRKANGNCLVFANFDPLLSEYFLLGGQAKEKQLETFSNYCPTLHRVLKGEEEVKAVRALQLGELTFDVIGLHVAAADCEGENIHQHPSVEEAISKVTATALRLCQEINGSTHLAVWRKFLRGVWLHL